MPAACALAPPGQLAPAVLGELVAPLANMAEAALAARAPATAGVSGGDPRRAEGDQIPSGAHGARVYPPVDPGAGPRAHRVHAAPVPAGPAGGPAPLVRRPPPGPPPPPR